MSADEYEPTSHRPRCNWRQSGCCTCDAPADPAPATPRCFTKGCEKARYHDPEDGCGRLPADPAPKPTAELLTPTPAPGEGVRIYATASADPAPERRMTDEQYNQKVRSTFQDWDWMDVEARRARAVEKALIESVQTLQAEKSAVQDALVAAIQRAEEAEKARAAWERATMLADKDAVTTNKRAESAEALVSVLVEALKKIRRFGHHDNGCRINTSSYGRCNCGFADACESTHATLALVSERGKYAD